MNRTPIKIPGKKTRDGSKAAIAARKALGRPPGRPLKLTAATKQDKHSDLPIVSANRPKKRSLKHIKSRCKMSLLEKLPTELLVEIFLYSMNLDLPRSSPIIGAKLTSELVYTRTVVEAFGPTWEKEYGKYRACPLRSYAYLKDDYMRDLLQPLSEDYYGEGDGKLQSAILRCRWASLPVLQKSQESWISDYGKQRTFTPLPFLRSFEIDVELTLEKFRRDRNLVPAKFFDEDFAEFSSYCSTQFRNEETIRSGFDVSVYKDWSTYVDVAGDFEIPQSLLLGPWTEDMIRLLYWLVKGGARLGWLNSTTGEAAMLGFKTALTEGNLRAIHLLFWAGLWDSVGVEEMLWVVQNAGRDRFNVTMEAIYLWCGAHRDRREFEEISAELRGWAEADSDSETADYINLVLKEISKR